MNKEDLEEAFLVVVSPLAFKRLRQEVDLLNHEFNNLLAINGAVEDFVEEQIDEETFLDIVEHHGQPMDEYIRIAEYNLKSILGA